MDGRGGGTYLGWGEGVPTLDGGRRYLPWMGEGGTYLGWGGGTYLEWGEGVPTLDGGGVPTLDVGRGYLPWMRGVPTLDEGERVPTLDGGGGESVPTLYMLCRELYASCIYAGGLSC